MKGRLNDVRATLLALLLAVGIVGLTGCGAQQTTGEPSDAAATAESGEGADDPTQKEYARALAAEGIVTSFIGESFYDGTITNQDEASAAVESVIERMGGDETTKLELMAERPTESGNTYYVFNQRAGDVLVHGASVKLIVDKDNKAIGLVSALLPNVQLEDLEEWASTQEQAEQAVRDKCASEGVSSVEIIKGATEQTVIPLQNGTDRYRYAWVVYTDNYYPDMDVAYLAHYLDEEAGYLYSIGVSEPGSKEALAGNAAAFSFDNMEATTWTGTVTTADGSTKELTVPTVTDPDTGDVYLGDAKRKILCADYAQFNYNETIAARTPNDGKFEDNELLAYDCFIRVWDFYDSIGWTGPDGEGTPTLIMMDMVDQNGEVIQNACYAGRSWGFQTFAFNRLDPDGECTDIVAHEFTHCVTTTTMTTNLYVNDYASINEGMSDVLGNLVEMLIDYHEDGAWLIGENEGKDPYRSMKDPHAFKQPEYAWDMYYGPAVAQGTAANDNGGAHVNCSLLNIVSYKLGQAGMEPADQFYFWMNVALAMTPLTDYPQLAELLPWCMEQAGYPQYVDALNEAIAQARYTETKSEAPTSLPEKCGAVRIVLPEGLEYAAYVRAALLPVGAEAEIAVWPAGETNTITAIVPAGEYIVAVVAVGNESVLETKLYASDGWTEDDSKREAVKVVEGETLELTNAGLDDWPCFDDVELQPAA